MKVMDVPAEDKDCSIETLTPPRKKLKQARLPFQMLSSSDPSNAISHKKRKLVSPSSVDCRSPKTPKVGNKDRTVSRAKESVVEIIELDVEDNEKHVEKDANSVSKTKKSIPGSVESNVTTLNKEVTDIPTVSVSDDSVEADSNDSKKSDNEAAKDEKTESKKSINYGTLTAFLKKAQSKEEKDDVQLMSMSDYESGNSKDSNVAPKAKPGDEDSPKASGENSDQNNEEAEDKTVAESDGKSSLERKTEKHSADAKSHEADDDACHRKKSSVTSDDNLDSDSDTSSDEDPDDEPEKSSNETESKEKVNDENNADGTPKAKKSTAKNRKLTPKQIQKKMESAKKREERQQLRMEKKKKREEERKNRIKEKEERRREKEEKEKVEKEQRRKERELKEQKKQMEIELKQKEKEAKEEDRRKREEAKEEEKKRKEEERLEAERKKQKAASNFASFFVPKKQGSKASEEESVSDVKNFMPFEVKVDMRMAPITRRNMLDSEKSRFDELFNKGGSKRNELYLGTLKDGKLKPGKSGKTWLAEAKDVVIIDEDYDCSSDLVDQGNVAVEKLRGKLLMFKENRRPPFWGTWRKKSDRVNSRRPFAKDPKWFDYEVDSDDEWEEEEPGESLRGSDDERDEENPDDNEYDVDNEFMVPHGYLSEEEARADEEDGEDTSPETQKAKLKLLGEQFEAERNTKTARIKPRVIGCIWQGYGNTYAEGTAPLIKQFLMAREAWVKETPIVLCRPSAPVSPNFGDCGNSTQRTVSKQTPGSKKKRVPAEAMPDLIRLLHGNTHGRIFLMKEFITFWEKNKTNDKQISKLSLSQKIREIANWMACPDEGPMHLKSCWYVAEEVRKEFDCLDVGLPNSWSYSLAPKRKSEVDVDKAEREERDKEKEKKRVPLITQFTKKITQEEMQKQLTTVKSGRPVNAKATPLQEKAGKRVALISVGRGEPFPKLTRNNLLTKFIGCGDGKGAKGIEEVVITDDDSSGVEVMSRSENTDEKEDDGENKKCSAENRKNSAEEEKDIIQKTENSAEKKGNSTEKSEDSTENRKDIAEKKEDGSEKNEDSTENRKGIAEKKEDSDEKSKDGTENRKDSAERKEDIAEKKEESSEKTAEDNKNCTEKTEDGEAEKENSTENREVESIEEILNNNGTQTRQKSQENDNKTDDPENKFLPEPMDVTEDCIILD